MTDKITIANMALSHLGASTEIQDFDTDKTKEAQACRRFYDNLRQKVLRDFDWPFANAIDFLSQLPNPTGLSQPTVEWSYWYRYPSTAIAIRRILNGATRSDTADSRADFAVGRDAAGRVIYTNQAAPAQIQYTYDETDATRFPPDFADALSLLLASRMAPRLTGGDPQKLGIQAYQMYRFSISEAWANSANQEPRVDPPEADLITVRG